MQNGPRVLAEDWQRGFILTWCREGGRGLFLNDSVNYQVVLFCRVEEWLNFQSGITGETSDRRAEVGLQRREETSVGKCKGVK